MPTTTHIRGIRPSEQDGTEMDALGLQAFTNVAIHRLMFPRGEETREEELRWRSQRFWTNVRNPSKRFVVAVEETVSDDGASRSKIIGWAMWNSDLQPQPEKSDEEKEKEWQEKMEALPDVMDTEAYRKITEGFGELEKQWLDGDDPRDYWVLDVLAVHPDHQRKGLGVKLTKWGIAESAKEGKGIGLISRPMAKPLYSFLGFKVFAERYVGGDSQTAMRLDKPMKSPSSMSDRRALTGQTSTGR